MKKIIKLPIIMSIFFLSLGLNAQKGPCFYDAAAEKSGCGVHVSQCSNPDPISGETIFICGNCPMGSSSSCPR